MYGADWCKDCRRSKALLDSLEIDYDFIDIEADDSAVEKVIEINGGKKSIPVIVFADGTHLTEPTDPDLKAKLVTLNLAT
jgi:glutaredoxin-like protein